MKFAAGNLFFGLFTFLYSIDIISSQPNYAEFTTLVKLFPQSRGVHFPKIQEVYQRTALSIPNFTTLNGYPMTFHPEVLFKRGDFIFGFQEKNVIKLLGVLFDKLHMYPVFNTESHKWYTLSLSEIQKLGAGRFVPLVREHDKAHAVVHKRNHQVNSEAHDAASNVAYRKTKDYEGTLYSLTPEVVKSVKKYYYEEYDKAYRSHAEGPSGGR